jgi:hypothetical protein
MRAVVGKFVGAAPWMGLFYLVMALVLIPLTLMIALRGADAKQRPAIIKALAELMPWRRR